MLENVIVNGNRFIIKKVNNTSFCAYLVTIKTIYDPTKEYSIYAN